MKNIIALIQAVGFLLLLASCAMHEGANAKIEPNSGNSTTAPLMTMVSTTERAEHTHKLSNENATAPIPSLGARTTTRKNSVVAPVTRNTIITAKAVAQKPMPDENSATVPEPFLFPVPTPDEIALENRRIEEHFASLDASRITRIYVCDDVGYHEKWYTSCNPEIIKAWVDYLQGMKIETEQWKLAMSSIRVYACVDGKKNMLVQGLGQFVTIGGEPTRRDEFGNEFPIVQNRVTNFDYNQLRELCLMTDKRFDIDK